MGFSNMTLAIFSLERRYLRLTKLYPNDNKNIKEEISCVSVCVFTILVHLYRGRILKTKLSFSPR